MDMPHRLSRSILAARLPGPPQGSMRMDDMTAPTLVMGIGNLLMGDEGVGIRVVELLMSGFQFPESVEIIDAGTMGLGMLSLLKEREFVLVIDAVDGTGQEPGTVGRLAPEDIAPNQVLHSLHDTRFVNVLDAAALTGIVLDAECIGIQIAQIRQWETTLTPQLETALPAAVTAALAVLAERGVTPVARTTVDETARVIESIRSHGDE